MVFFHHPWLLFTLRLFRKCGEEEFKPSFLLRWLLWLAEDSFRMSQCAWVWSNRNSQCYLSYRFSLSLAWWLQLVKIFPDLFIYLYHVFIYKMNIIFTILIWQWIFLLSFGMLQFAGIECSDASKKVLLILLGSNIYGEKYAEK